MAAGRYHIVGYRMCRTKPTGRVHENIEVQRLDQSNTAILTDRKQQHQYRKQFHQNSADYNIIMYARPCSFFFFFRQFRLFLTLLYSCTHITVNFFLFFARLATKEHRARSMSFRVLPTWPPASSLNRFFLLLIFRPCNLSLDRRRRLIYGERAPL